MSSRPASDAEDESVAQFRSGMRPRRLQGRAEAGRGPVVTTEFSAWLGRQCATCRQTFRSGDLVRVDFDARTQHLAPDLHCAEDDRPDLLGPADDDRRNVRAFTAAILAAEAPGGPGLTILSAGDWRIARRESGVVVRCAFCSHTFRAGESVIVCPCAHRTDRPPVPGCGLTVHRDPSAGLDCWEQWRGASPLTRCPVVLDPLATPRDGS